MTRIRTRTAARRRSIVLFAMLVLIVGSVAPLVTSAATTHTFVPIGGGYETPTLEGFVAAAAQHGSRPTIDILIVPSSYGDAAEDRAENIELAQERTDQVEDACDDIAGDLGFTGCEATLLLLFDRADAELGANSALFDSGDTDGAFILGGDQTIAMQVLAGTIAESRMARAYERGVVFGGTSAGNAVESQDMIWGYTDDGWPYNALEKPMVKVWFNNDGDLERGLVFGSENVIFDQHFYERGRFARLLNVIAQSEEAYEGNGKLGVGVDWGTGVHLTNDQTLHDVFGYSSTAIVDGETLDGTFAWRGKRQTLTARNILTHVFAQHADASLDVVSREVTMNGKVVDLNSLKGWRMPGAPGSATLYLGGDLSLDFKGPAMRGIVNDIMSDDAGKVLIIATGFDTPRNARGALADYRSGMQSAGLDTTRFPVETVIHSNNNAWQRLNASKMAGYDAVIVVGGDQLLMSSAVYEAKYRSILSAALQQSRVVVTDSAATAIMGDWYVPNADPTEDDYQDVGIEDFQTGAVRAFPGLGIVKGFAFEPMLTWDQKWGRIYALTMLHPDTIAVGLSEITAIKLQGNTARLMGERSAVVLDGRGATYANGENGAFSAFNVVLDTYSPGDLLAARR